MSTWTKERSRLARLHQTHSPDAPEITQARQSLKAARLEDQVTKALAEAPPLTDEQRERIASLLRVNPQRPQQDHADIGLTATDHQVGGDVG